MTNFADLTIYGLVYILNRIGQTFQEHTCFDCLSLILKSFNLSKSKILQRIQILCPPPKNLAPKKKASSSSQAAAARKKTKNLIKLEQKANPDYGQSINPISRLIQIQQAKKQKEPVYTLIAERGMPRRREFVMQVSQFFFNDVYKVHFEMSFWCHRFDPFFNGFCPILLLCNIFFFGFDLFLEARAERILQVFKVY